MYITVDYYRNEYMGVPVADDTELTRLIKRATDAIDAITHYRIVNYGYNKFSPFIQEQIKKATAAQVEFLSSNGELAGSVIEKGSGYTIGKFSEQKDSVAATGSVRPKLSERYALTVIDYLSPTGLLYSGVRTEQRRRY